MCSECIPHGSLGLQCQLEPGMPNASALGRRSEVVQSESKLKMFFGIRVLDVQHCAAQSHTTALLCDNCSALCGSLAWRLMAAQRAQCVAQLVGSKGCSLLTVDSLQGPLKPPSCPPCNPCKVFDSPSMRSLLTHVYNKQGRGKANMPSRQATSGITTG